LLEAGDPRGVDGHALGFAGGSQGGRQSAKKGAKKGQGELKNAFLKGNVSRLTLLQYHWDPP
jgi:hypothetical protein